VGKQRLSQPIRFMGFSDRPFDSSPCKLTILQVQKKRKRSSYYDDVYWNHS